jgi:hypothetical protein
MDHFRDHLRALNRALNGILGNVGTGKDEAARGAVALVHLLADLLSQVPEDNRLLQVFEPMLRSMPWRSDQEKPSLGKPTRLLLTSCGLAVQMLRALAVAAEPG